MSKKWRFLTLLAGLLWAVPAFAQNNTEMADTMRSNGRIYVVVAVLVTILLGLLFYVFRLDRRITRLEKEENN